MNNRVLFLLSKGISYVGTKLFSFVLSWYILTQTGSGLSFSISLLVNYLPTIIISLVAGKISDKARHPNRFLVIYDVLSASVCVVPLIFFNLTVIYCTIFTLSCISALFNNIVDTHLPNLDGLNDSLALKRLASTSQFITSGVNILAPSVGGLLMEIIPVRLFAVINIVSFLASAFGELFLKYSVKNNTEKEQQSKTKGKLTLLWLIKSREFRPFLFGDGLVNFCVTAGISVAVPFIVTNTMGISSGGYGLITSCLGFGSVLSALFHVKYPSKTELRYPYVKMGIIGAAMIMIGVVTLLPYHNVATIIALCCLEFTTGWLCVACNIKIVTTLQLYIQDDMRGKVLGTFTAVSFSLIPVSLLLAGTATEYLKSYAIPLISGFLLLLLLGVIRLLDMPDIANRNIEDDCV